MKVVILGGPTASGKSGLAFSLVEKFPLEIVNFDSMQVYRYMDIGTAKPPAAMRDAFPHHLYDIKNPDEYFSAAEYVKEAARAAGEIYKRGKTPLFVGGTGFYMRSYLLGLDDLPSSRSVREDLFDRLRREGLKSMYREVEEKDPDFAKCISENDRARIIRALEVMSITGARYSSLRKRWKAGVKRVDDLFIVLSPDREELYEKINVRVDQMLAAGLIDEVKGLLDMGFSKELRTMQSLGYRHVVSYLEGAENLSQTAERIKRDTRKYAKRQLTWFRREDARWFAPKGEQKIYKLVDSFLI